MSRSRLLGAASAAVLSCLSAHATTAAPNADIQGGGASSSEFVFFGEFPIFNNAQPGSGAAVFNNQGAPANSPDDVYWPAGATSGQTAFLNDDLTCDSNKVLNLNNKACSNLPPGTTNYVDYAVSDATLNSTQEAQWGSSTLGQSAAGDLIQIPVLGNSIAFPIQNSSVPQSGGNGQVTLTDTDLCGIFSGKIQNWNQTSAAASLTPGQISVVYRSDGSGATFLVLNHFSAVCTSSNSNFAFPLNVTTTFQNAFTGGVVPSNFIAETSSQAVAGELVSLSSALGYVTPDYTTVDPNSSATLANGSKSPLVVPSIYNSVSKTAYVPTVANITLALKNAKTGQHLTPPTTAAAAANPDNWVPLIQTVKSGYPVVGYTTIDLAQCYATPAVATAIISFLKLHSSNTSYETIQTNNGFVPVGKTGASKFVSAITADILANKKSWNVNIQNATACAGLAGR